MTRQEELNEAWCKYMGKCSTEIIQALAFALKWADAHPHWISVEDELPKYKQWVIAHTKHDDPPFFCTRYEAEELSWRLVSHWMQLPQAPKKRDKKILKKLYAKCIQSAPLGLLIVGQVYKCEAWQGKTLISGASGSMAMDSKNFLEHFTPMKGDEQ